MVKLMNNSGQNFWLKSRSKEFKNFQTSKILDSFNLFSGVVFESFPREFREGEFWEPKFWEGKFLEIGSIQGEFWPR